MLFSVLPVIVGFDTKSPKALSHYFNLLNGVIIPDEDFQKHIFPAVKQLFLASLNVELNK
ncbi:hypothetical protein ADICYQ_2374 [Cyclobacterium qasimii M12-11B]|uniref:Uncharacterized protein n=1 Tax=Cyclobacterium qasimii M12-11B TaxID=641524 RepID=S7VET7_9BACT|nr:hypothetical protein ADICYQ_2374 [Cyclobacterium qasimii M12-11B]